MSKELRELIEKRAELKAKFSLLQERSDASEDLVEVRAIGETLKALKTEIEEVEEKIAELEEKDESADDEKDNPADDEKDNSRGFNPLATYRIGTPGVSNAEIEKRAQKFAESGKMSIPGAEARAILLSSGSIATPTGVGGINDSFNNVSSIVDQVKVEDCTGMSEYNVAYEKAGAAAGVGTEGTAPSVNDPVFRVAAIKPYLVNTLSYVSKAIRKQTPLLYEEKVRDSALKALRKKVGALILTGNGTTEPFGILNAKNTEKSAEEIYSTLELSGIDENTLRNIVFAYGGNETVGANACLYLNKNDLVAFGDVRGTNEKGAVYEIIPDGANPNTGVIKDGGLSVPYCIISDAKALSTSESNKEKTMAYGDPMNYTLGLFGDYEIEVSDDYKFAERQLAVLGEVYVGGNITVDQGFVVITKKVG